MAVCTQHSTVHASLEIYDRGICVVHEVRNIATSVCVCV